MTLSVLGPRTMTVSDFNNDGEADLAVASSDDEAITAYLGMGDGEFLLSETLSLDSPPVYVVSGDLTNDGTIDLVGWSTFSAAGSPKIWQGVGDGTFLDEGFVDTAHKLRSAEVRDFDGDSLMDFLYVSESSDVFVWLRSSQDGLPEVPSVVETGGGTRQLELADVDNDGDPELAVVEFNGAQIEIFEIGGPAGVEIADTIPLAFSPRHAGFFDANNDGTLDILASSADGTVRRGCQDVQGAVVVGVEEPGVPWAERERDRIGDLDPGGSADLEDLDLSPVELDDRELGITIVVHVRQLELPRAAARFDDGRYFREAVLTRPEPDEYIGAF